MAKMTSAGSLKQLDEWRWEKWRWSRSPYHQKLPDVFRSFRDRRALNAGEFATALLDCFPSSWIISRLPLAPRAVIYCKREGGRDGLNDFPDMAANGRTDRHGNAFRRGVNDSLRKCKLAEIVSRPALLITGKMRSPLKKHSTIPRYWCILEMIHWKLFIRATLTYIRSSEIHDILCNSIFQMEFFSTNTRIFYITNN